MLATLALATALSSAPDAMILVRFEGLEPKGQVQVALFASGAAWKTRDQALRSTTLVLSGPWAEARFGGLPPGEYAVMAYHDKNANEQLDTLPIGLPVEPYGFSNNARATFGPPPWRAARFTAGSDQTVQQIRLR